MKDKNKEGKTEKKKEKKNIEQIDRQQLRKLLLAVSI